MMSNIKWILSHIWQSTILIKDHFSEGPIEHWRSCRLQANKTLSLQIFLLRFHCAVLIQPPYVSDPNLTVYHMLSCFSPSRSVRSSAFGSRNTYFLPLSTGTLVLPNLTNAFVIFKSSETKSTIILFFSLSLSLWDGKGQSASGMRDFQTSRQAAQSLNCFNFKSRFIFQLTICWLLWTVFNRRLIEGLMVDTLLPLDCCFGPCTCVVVCDYNYKYSY